MSFSMTNQKFNCKNIFLSIQTIRRIYHMKIKENNKTTAPSIDLAVHPTYKAQIDKSATNMVMDILAKLYDNPLAAAIREYTSNAIDAHTAAGVNKVVEVHLPSENNQWLTVRDYGKGLTAFDILTTYANFGSSDKRDSDALIGGFGIGSKSGLAISDAVYINSWTGGKLNSFVLKHTSDGIVTQFLKENVDAPDIATGTEVKVFVNKSYLDLGNEYDQLGDMYTPLAGWPLAKVRVQHDNPNIAQFINENRIPDSWHEFEHGYTSLHAIQDNSYIFHGVLVGNVYYGLGVDMEHIYHKIPDFDYKNGFLNQSFVLKLDIADVRVNYSREKILWQESKETLNALTHAIKGLVNDIKLAVDSIKACNLDPDNYIQRLLALQLNPKQTYNYDPTEYDELLLKTTAFDFSKPLTIDNVRMEFFHTHSHGLRSSSTQLHHSIRIPSLSPQYYIIVDDAMPLNNSMNNVRRVLQAIYKLYRDPQVDLSTQPDLKSIDTQFHYKGTLPFIIIHQADFAKLPSIYCPNHDDFARLRAAKKTIIQQSKTDNNAADKIVTPRSQRVYTMTKCNRNSPTLESLNQNASYDDQCKTLLLPHDSKYAFMAKKNISRASQTILATLPFTILLCAKTRIDFERMKAAQPNAIVMSDDEISTAIAKYLHEHMWAANDTFCKTVLTVGQYYILAVDDDKNQYCEDWRPTHRLGIPYQSSSYDLNQIKCEINRINKYKDSEPAYADIQKLMQAMPSDTHPHQLTNELRLAFSLTSHTYLYRQELDDLIDKIKSQYTYEIDLMQKLN